MGKVPCQVLLSMNFLTSLLIIGYFCIGCLCPMWWTHCIITQEHLYEGWGIRGWLPIDQMLKSQLKSHLEYIFVSDWMIRLEGGTKKLSHSELFAVRFLATCHCWIRFDTLLGMHGKGVGCWPWGRWRWKQQRHEKEAWFVDRSLHWAQRCVVLHYSIGLDRLYNANDDRMSITSSGISAYCAIFNITVSNVVLTLTQSLLFKMWSLVEIRYKIEL